MYKNNRMLKNTFVNNKNAIILIMYTNKSERRIINRGIIFLVALLCLSSKVQASRKYNNTINDNNTIAPYG